MADSNYLVYAFILLLAVLIIVSVIKKVFKLLIFIVAVIIAFSAYNILVKGVSPIDELNGYKKDITYGRDIADYTIKIKNSAANIKNAVDAGKMDTAAKKTINTENRNLHNYQSEVKALKHTNRLNGFHEKYCSFLDDVVASADGTSKVANASDGKTVSQISGIVEKLNSSMENLVGLNINDYKK